MPILLTPQKRKVTYNLLESYKSELDNIQTTYNVISKYHQQWWYQQSMQKSESELWQMAVDCISKIDDLKQVIEETENILILDYNYQKKLNGSRKPYTGLNLIEYQLHQQVLFD